MSATWFFLLLGIVPGLCAGATIMLCSKRRVPLWDVVWFMGILLGPTVVAIVVGIIVQLVFL